MDASSAFGPTVAGLVADTQLALRVVVSGDVDRPLEGAHASELLDPTPWLEGGELLMTTGLQLGDPASMTGYVERLERVGVVCLALGTGERLTHATVPGALIEAAQRSELPLLEVPEQTPFLAITSAVYGQLATQRYAEQLRALEAQRALTASAVHPGGLSAIAGTLAGLSGMDVLVLDSGGVELTSAPPAAAALRQEVLADLDRLRAHGLKGAAALHRPGQVRSVQPLGTSQLRGFLVCASPTAPAAYGRQLAAAAVSPLTLELERASRAGTTERERRTQVGRALLHGGLDGIGAARLLATLGSRAGEVRAVVARRRTGHAGRLAIVEDALWSSLPDVLLVAGDDELTALALDPPDDLTDRVATALGASAQVVAGLGARVPIAEAPRSARQAIRAAQAARDPGQVVDVLALASSRLLLELQAPEALAHFADTLLGPVDRAGPRAQALLASLRAYLECNGARDDAASRLGVHRHTLRQRIRTIEQLTGRRLDVSHDRMELMLALEARDLAPGAG